MTSAIQTHGKLVVLGICKIRRSAESFNWELDDQLPVGLIAQLVKHCTGIAGVMGSNPVQA